MNTIGKIFRLTSFGESHGDAVGGVIDGMPVGISVDEDFIQGELDRRRPGQSAITSPRNESDRIEILSGVFEGKTTGMPIGFLVRNENQRSQDYSEMKDLFRPSHADFTYQQKYGIRDYRGGGRQSARETISRVVAGAFAKLALREVGINIEAYTSQIGNIVFEGNYLRYDISSIESNDVRCPDAATAERMIEAIKQASAEGDTLGGVVSCVISGCPIGLGEPVFGKLHAALAAAEMSINAVRGFEIGDGFAAASKRGTEYNDVYAPDGKGGVKTLSNHSGGVQGGISNGEDITFRVAFKPVPTLKVEQLTVDVNGRPAIIKPRGRHDPCVVPRAVPIVEAMAAITVLDYYLLKKQTLFNKQISEMKTKFTVFAAAFALLFAVSDLSAQENADGDLHIIPQPQKVVRGQGIFNLKSSTTFYVKNKDVKTVASYFAAKFKDATGFDINITNKRGNGAIALLLGNKGADDESYTLNVDAQGVEAVAPTPKGLFYAMQTFMQLLPPQIESPYVVNNISWTAPAVSITDKPRFKYRGLHNDVCRHFQTLETLKKEIDVMALFKLNNFHLHLTEDQAWRIEIKKYPKLTEVGSWRDQGDENHVNGFYNPTHDNKYGGFYTQNQIRDLVAYAQARFVNIIPEVEMPGHEVAAISAYPWLSCRGEQQHPWNTWGVSDVVMCPGKETTFEFLENVLKEIIPLFPGKYFHIGGDESPRTEWKNCPLCQQRAKELGITEHDGRSVESQLQSYLVGRMEKFLNKYGKSIIGWDEILEGGNLNKTATIMSWRGEAGGIAGAKAGHHVILTPGFPLYLDWYQDSHDVEPTAIIGLTTVQNIFNYNPMPKEVEESGSSQYILGPQGNMWGEFLPDGKMLEYRVFPRALAISEIGWTELANKDSLNFFKALDADASVRMREHGINYHIPIPTTGDNSYWRYAFTDEAEVPLSTIRPEKIIYTVDGTEPNANSAVYKEPLHFKESTTLRVATMLPSGIIGGQRTIQLVKEPYSPAISKQDTVHGLALNIAKGLFKHAADLDKEEMPMQVKEIKDLSQLHDVGDLKDDYSTIAEGYVLIPEDGIYGFSSENDQVLIDDKLVMDKDNVVMKRFSAGKGSIALKKGLHKIKVIFLGFNGDGWPTYGSATSVQICNESKHEAMHDITPAMLYFDGIGVFDTKSPQ